MNSLDVSSVFIRRNLCQRMQQKQIAKNFRGVNLNAVVVDRKSILNTAVPVENVRFQKNRVATWETDPSFIPRHIISDREIESFKF